MCALAADIGAWDPAHCEDWGPRPRRTPAVPPNISSSASAPLWEMFPQLTKDSHASDLGREAMKLKIKIKKAPSSGGYTANLKKMLENYISAWRNVIKIT